MYDFVVAELKVRASKCPHRLEPICRALQDQRDDLLAFARRLDEDLEQLGQELQIPAELARHLLRTLSRNERNPRRWAEEAVVENSSEAGSMQFSLRLSRWPRRRSGPVR